MTLVKLGPEGGRGERDVFVLAGEGPHEPVAPRRAAEFVEAASTDTRLTPLNVQLPGADDEECAPEERGGAVVYEFVDRAGIESTSYDRRVEVADDVEPAIVAVASEYDTIRIGATRSGSVSQAVFGSLPESVGERSDRTVVVVRGPGESPMSIREAIVQRFEL